MSIKPPALGSILWYPLVLALVCSPLWGQEPAAPRTSPERRESGPPASGNAAGTADSTATTATLRSNPFAFAFGRRSGRRQRLVRIPDMFGDFFSSGGLTADSGPDFVTVDLPLAGGSRRAKAAEHNKAIVDDRIYVTYHHFHNALEVDTVAGLVPEQSSHVDRYLAAVEKPLNEVTSIEVRMPFTNGFNYSEAAFTSQGGEVGDLALLWKRVLHQCECHAVSAGLGITLPTGSDARGSFPLLATTYEVRNEAIHFAPFLAYSRAGERAFTHAFAQVDFAANGNRVTVNDIGLAVTSVGQLNEQSLFYLDLSAGYWLYDNPCGELLTGAAALLEFHFTTTVQDADVVAFPALTPGPSFGGADNRFDVSNLTIGVHLETAAQTAIRFGGVFPLATAPGNRFFNSEVQVAVVRKF